jgi:translation initiation factor 2 subunit 1
MYESKYPEVDELVMVNVQSIGETGTHVRLLEYDDIEGMILSGELSRRRIRSIQKLVRVGRNEVVVVLRVDKEKGYIDLSKKRVSAEDIQVCEERFAKSKAVHTIMRTVSEHQNVPLLSLYQQIGWPLYKKYGHAFEAFKLALSEEEEVFKDIEVDPKIKKDLLEIIARRLSPKKVKFRADLEVTCGGVEGILAIKEALTNGLQFSTEDIPLKVKMIKMFNRRFS